MPRPLPWLISYSEDPYSAGRYPDDADRLVLRPLLEVSLVGSFPMEHKVLALVDSGSEHTLVAPGLARAIGLETRNAFREIPLGLGGEWPTASFLDVTMRLHHPDDASLDEALSWEAEIGFLDRTPRAAWSVLLGQVGFLDLFTVTMHRHAQQIAIESREVFDERFGIKLESARYPNLRPFSP